MNPIVVFTPTNNFGGIDVNYASLARQTVRDRIIWIVADELLERRAPMWDVMKVRSELMAIEAFKVHGQGGRSLASSYRAAMRMARGMGAEMFVSLQDYFWIAEDGVEKFLEGMELHPGCLLTGHASIADNPGPEKVTEPEGLYTVFERPFTDKPEESWSWEEIRGWDQESWYPSNPIEWEINWAAIPGDVLKLDVDFDVRFDPGIACENQDYAFQLQEQHGTQIWADASNCAIGIPHKMYFPEKMMAQAQVVPYNRQIMLEKWNVPV
jgi:hypothetical protein